MKNPTEVARHVSVPAPARQEAVVRELTRLRKAVELGGTNGGSSEDGWEGQRVTRLSAIALILAACSTETASNAPDGAAPDSGAPTGGAAGVAGASGASGGAAGASGGAAGSSSGGAGSIDAGG